MGRPLATPNPLPELERLNLMLDYREDDGTLFWKEREASSFSQTGMMSGAWQAELWNSKYGGKPAGSRQGGYHRVMIDGLSHMSHRVIWKMKTGSDPVYIDHIDGDRGNNRFSNLRSVEHAINMKNKALYSTNKTGIPGVEYHERDKVWRAKIGVDGGQVQLGSYPTKHEATIARIAGQIMLDYHENHGRSKVLKEN